MTKAVYRCRAARQGEIGLFSVDEQSARTIGKLKRDKDVVVDVQVRRNPRQHRLFFAILNFVRQHSPMFESASIETIKRAVKLATDQADTFIDADTGKSYYVLRSMACDAMDEEPFNEFFNDAVSVIAKRWMPSGTTPESVRAELIRMVDGPGQYQGSKVA